MRVLRSMALAVAALGVLTATATGSDESEALGAPQVVSQTASTTTFDDGTRLIQAASFASCADGWVCLWSGQNYSGSLLQLQDRGYWINLGNYFFNDTAESWRNRTNDDARVAAGTGGAGDMRCLGANSANSTFGTYNDQASSIRIYKVNDIC